MVRQTGRVSGITPSAAPIHSTGASLTLNSDSILLISAATQQIQAQQPAGQHNLVTYLCHIELDEN